MTKFIIIPIVLLSGCSMIPSLWDDNEAYAVADVRHKVDIIECSVSYMGQVNDLESSVRFLELYSESKGSTDLYDMIQPMQDTIDGMQKMPENAVFCKLKKKQLVKQSALIADAAMSRF